MARIHELATGKLLSTIGPNVRSLPRFSPDARMVVSGGQVFEARTGKLLWKAEADSRIGQFTPDARTVFLASPAGAVVADAATGRRLMALDAREAVIVASEDGAWLLTVRGGEYTLRDTKASTARWCRACRC